MSLSDAHTLEPNTGTAEPPAAFAARLAARFAETAAARDLAGNIARLVDGGPTRPETLVAIVEWADIEPRFDLRRLGGWSPDAVTPMSRSS